MTIKMQDKYIAFVRQLAAAQLPQKAKDCKEQLAFAIIAAGLLERDRTAVI